MSTPKVLTESPEDFQKTLLAHGFMPDPYLGTEPENTQKTGVFGNKNSEKNPTFSQQPQSEENTTMPLTQEEVAKMITEAVAAAKPAAAPAPTATQLSPLEQYMVDHADHIKKQQTAGLEAITNLNNAIAQSNANFAATAKVLATMAKDYEDSKTWQAQAINGAVDVAKSAVGMGVAFGVYTLVGKIFGDAPLPPPV